MPLRKKDHIISVANNLIIDYPSPINISNWWNFGSFLGLFIVFQTLTGIFLRIHYVARVNLAFDSVVNILHDVNIGWLFRSFHATGASFIFIFVYLHIIRGIYYQSFKFTPKTWLSGIVILLLLILTAFLGYVLPWGQIRFWAATVITNIISAIPFFGTQIVQWIWGGFAVREATLTRFYSFHFVFPFIILALIFIHLLILHQTGSNNPLNLSASKNKIPFSHYFIYKDLFSFLVIIFFYLAVVLFYPIIFNEPENFISANPLSTPAHIKPEWYFLWAYAILRAIPRKLGGVLAILIAIVAFFFFPLKSFSKNTSIYVKIFFIWTALLFILSWIGGCPVEWPYDFLRKVACFSYFFLLLVLFIV
jgi:ubiquinol-cytochrome c reductase cytochrome b subunit